MGSRMAEDDVAAGGFAGHEFILHRVMEGTGWSRQVAHAWFCDAARDGRLDHYRGNAGGSVARERG